MTYAPICDSLLSIKCKVVLYRGPVLSRDEKVSDMEMLEVTWRVTCLVLVFDELVMLVIHKVVPEKKKPVHIPW